MKTMQMLLTHSLLYLIVLLRPATSQPYCPASYYAGTQVKFPFRVDLNQTIGCGYPGFDLRTEETMDGQTHVIINLPDSGDFIVDQINYGSQKMRISDPNQCFMKRFLEKTINFTGSPFSIEEPEKMFLINCSSSSYLGYLQDIPCLSSGDYTVGLVSDQSSRRECSIIGNVTVSREVWWLETVGIRVSWKEPDCKNCERQGKYCGLNSTRVVGCFDYASGFRAGTGNAMKMFFILPGFLCIFCIIFVVIVRYRSHNSLRNQLQITEAVVPPTTNISSGLPNSVIEKYPKIYIGESKRLPIPNDNICAICLSEYEAKETLRTMPNCNHYFHLDCIDQWLFINRMCPMCRE